MVHHRENEKIDKRNVENLLPLAPTQQGILVEYLRNRYRDQYHEQLVLHLEGELQDTIFAKAWESVIQDNEALRTVFRWERLEQPVQIVMKTVVPAIQIVDLRHEANPDGALNLCIEQDKAHRFDLKQAPFRVQLFRLRPGHAALLVSHHHILYDGWSTAILLQQFAAHYTALRTGQAPQKPRKASLHAYLEWLQQQDRQEQRQYWVRHLAGYEPKSILREPKAAEVATDGGAVYRSAIDDLTTARIKQFATDYALPASTLLYAAWGIVLFQYCNSDDVVFGTTVAIRPDAIRYVEGLVGLLINTVPLRLTATPDTNVLEWLRQLRSEQAARVGLESSPLADLISEAGYSRPEHLMESLVVLENYPLDRNLLQGTGLRLTDFANYERTSFGVTLVIQPQDTGYSLKLLGNGQRFDLSFLEQAAAHYKQALLSLMDNCEQSIARVSILEIREQERIRTELCSGMQAALDDGTIHARFEARVREHPDRTAIITAHGQLTYRQLNEAANRLAHRLLMDGTLPRGRCAGLLLLPSVEMVAAILAVMKAGGVYVPLDPNAPAERNRLVLDDCEASVLLTTAELQDQLGWRGKQLLVHSDLEDAPIHDPGLDICSGELAYVIYTSGSTGKPKGVMVEHRSVLNLLDELETAYPLLVEDTYLLKTAYTFDVSVTELFGWFIGSGRVAIPAPGQEKSAQGLIEAVKTFDATHINVVPSMLSRMMDVLEPQLGAKDILGSLRYLFAAGEELKPAVVNRFFKLGTAVRLENLYGPTESTVYATRHSLRAGGDDSVVPIGAPIRNLRCYVVDKHLRLQPPGVPGQLCLAGVGLARGYLNREEQQRASFISSSFDPVQTLYLTGDLACMGNDGELAYMGRVDQQLKLRGLRIEAGEIESLLMACPGVQEAVILLHRAGEGREMLCAFYRAEDDIGADELRALLKQKLPEYMIPVQLHRLESFPVTASGKVDRIALERQLTLLQPQGSELARPQNQMEVRIAAIWKELLKRDTIGLDDNFFDVGGNSLDLFQMNSRLAQLAGAEVAATAIFQYPTIRTMAHYLERGESNESDDALHTSAQGDSQGETPSSEHRSAQPPAGVAIIGMSVRLPGAHNLAQFWSNLEQGKESISFFDDEQLIKAGADPEAIRLPNYVKAQGVMEGAELFDAEFFGYTPLEAQVMDPQARVLHEVAWETMEDAGYGSAREPRKTGVFVSASPNLYWESLVASSDRVAILGELASEQLFNKDYLAMRLAYKLNLTGPAANVYTACSSSLVAVHQACESLLRQDCEMALVGSATLSPLPDRVGYLHHEGMVRSPDGHCRAFDIDSQGFVGGTGAAAVLLKREEDAMRDGDTIYAVIRASTVNNDGQLKIGYTAPSVEGIKQAVGAVLRKGKIEAESIRYVETHGAATPLGDSVEIDALTQAFQSHGRAYCGIGSVKSNIGHLDCTSGIAGLVKTALALKHRVLPPTLNIRVPNPTINFIASPFYPVMEAETWEAGETAKAPLRAMSISLGLGGTNAIAVLEEAPVRQRVTAADPEPVELLMPVSARTSAALEAYRERLLEHMKRNPELSLADCAHTLAAGREHWDVRQAFVCRTKDQWTEQLRGQPEPNPLQQESASLFVLATAPPSQLRGIYSLYGKQKVFTEALEECATIMLSGGTRELQAHMTQIAARDEAASADKQQDKICFSLQYALVRTLLAWGIRPLCYVGDPLGQLVALAASGPLPRKAMLSLAKQWLDNRLQAEEWERVVRPVSSAEERTPILDLDGRRVDIARFAAVNTHLPFQQHARGERKLMLSDLPQAGSVICWEMVCETEIEALSPVYRVACWSEPSSQSENLLNRLLTWTGWLWERGAELNWAAVRGRDAAVNVPLPVYPFERRRYWIDGTSPIRGSQMGQERSLRRKDKLEDWFYAPGWAQKPLVQRAQTNDSVCMVIGGSDPLHAELIAQLRGLAKDVLAVELGDRVQRLDKQRYTVTLSDEGGMLVLLQQLKGELRMPDHIICLLELSDPGTATHSMGREDEDAAVPDAESSFYASIYAAQALQQLNNEKPVRISVVASHLQHVTGLEPLHPLQSAVLGPLKVIPQEIPFIRCQSIDVEYPRSPVARRRLLRSLADELLAAEPASSVAYRNHIRYEPSYQPVPLPEASAAESRFRHQGVYLITGGLGNIGLAIAGHLAVRYAARLILVGRTAFPAREEREQWLAERTEAEPGYAKVRQIVEWERQGAIVVTCAADVSDGEQLSRAVAEAEAALGPINGVIHAAGSMRESLFCTLTDLTSEQCVQQFLPKLGGLQHLTTLFGHRQLDFLHVTSSTSAVLGGLGFAAYAAANIAMDAFIHDYNSRSDATPWTSANWEGWRFEGDSRPVDREFALSELMMEPDEGVEAWARIIHHDLPRLVVSSGDLELRLSRWVTGLHAAAAGEDRASGSHSVGRPRPQLDAPYVSPANRMEEQIVGVLQQFYGYDEIGRDDNFFELGASSLDMIQIASRLRSELQHNIPIVQLFTYPTVRLLAEALNRKDEPAVPADMDDGAEAQRAAALTRGRSSLQSRYSLRKK